MLDKISLFYSVTVGQLFLYTEKNPEMLSSVFVSFSVKMSLDLMWQETWLDFSFFTV